jgi:hypothetical protein
VIIAKDGRVVTGSAKEMLTPEKFLEIMNVAL